ncbi:MAG TPA: HlyD family secretion protein, partial [Solirubrobacterales bacterium]|nr:HlyD family secretion protein [Solirubrobacterales bacterium]
VYQLSEQEYLKIQSRLQKDPAAQRGDNLELILSDGSVFPHHGHVLFEDRQIDVKTGTIASVAVFPNPGNVLRPGQYAQIRAVTEVKRNALLVPQRAVNELQGGFQVGVVGSDDKVVVKTVVPGVRVAKLWQIDSGLSPGDRVIVEGFSRVKSGAAVKPEEAPPEAAAADAGSASSSAASSSPSAPPRAVGGK